MSDVPLGMFLSGGIDSSAIAALMARMIDRPLQTFSVAFKERAFNELAYAREIAREVGADSHEIVIDDRDFFGAMPKLVWHEDEPIAHPSSVPLYFVSALARQHVTVVLTGEGSDELLAGYGKYLRASWNWRGGAIYERIVPGPLRATIATRLVPRLPGRVAHYAQRSFLAMDRTPESMFLDNFAAIRLRDQRQLLTPSHQPRVTRANAYGSSLEYFQRPNGDSSVLDRLLYADIKTYLVELLMKQDQMSMATSVESRVPFLDHKLVEFAAQLPDEWKLSGWTTKRVLREAMKGVLPDSILKRPKMGFPVPFGSWTRGAWNDVAREVLLDRRSRERGIFDPPAVDRLLADHAAGRTDGSDRVWTLLNLELWYRTFIDRQGVQTLPQPAVMRGDRGAESAARDNDAPPLAEVRSAAAAR
jgi:asparagine synthase (glutamine-hydrolysing)